MRIVKAPEPSWGRSLSSKETNAEVKELPKANTAERGNLNQYLNIILKSKLLEKFQPMDLFASTVNDGVRSGKNKFDDNRQRPWGFDAETNVYQDIRRLISQRRIGEAELKLSTLVLKTAQWYYLNGIVLWEKERYAEAYNCFKQAATMAPENREYAEALDYVLQAYYPFTVVHFFKRFFEKTQPWIYIIPIVLFMIWLVSCII